ncbi:MAG: heme lyase CcmF/NrfE family subunit [Myxococcota bacterium]
MNTTLGYGLVLAGLACAIFGAVVGLWTGMTRRTWALKWVQYATYGFAAFMLLANAVMVYALVTHDFSVKYVGQVGSRATPTVFTIVSLWSALEGSILFWGLVLGAYLFAFAFTYRKEHSRYMQLSLGVMLAMAVFFAFLIAGPADPWFWKAHVIEQLKAAGQPFPPLDGPGPNPLLQNHVLMIVHPPMLYLGYVGMVVPFGIAAGALLRGELGDSWMVPLRKWTLVPWLFLSIGIILGSWWAYAVLGWGGYWAWDPVENASFLPWLTATAYMHSTMVLERKRMLKLWTLSLALGSFLLTIVGTFMTRSGVFNSVHSFTQSDIGPTFLVFIAVLLVFSIVLLSVRGHLLVAENQLDSVVSREGSILLNNLVFVAITFTVLLGTIFPLVKEGLFGERISVGEPYFNKMAVPGGLLVLFLMGVGPMLPWGEARTQTLLKQLFAPTVALVATFAAAFVFVLRSRGLGVGGTLSEHGLALFTFGLAGFVTVITLREMFLPARLRMAEKKESAWVAVVRSASRANRRFGGYVVHLGIVAIIVAVAASSSFKLTTSGTVPAGKALSVGDYQVRFDGISQGKEPHRDWTAANITILGPGGKSESLTGQQGPRMNFYERSTDPVGSPAVRPKLFEDVYVSLLAYDGAKNTASFNTYVFPLVGWIWYAIPLLVLGAAIALWPQRKQVPVAEAPAPSSDAPPPVNPDLVGSP